MPQNVDLAEMQRLIADERAQLVEVLPQEDYEIEHIPGAINIPLKQLDADSVAALDRARPVITYCNNYE